MTTPSFQMRPRQQAGLPVRACHRDGDLRYLSLAQPGLQARESPQQEEAHALEPEPSHSSGVRSLRSFIGIPTTREGLSALAIRLTTGVPLSGERVGRAQNQRPPPQGRPQVLISLSAAIETTSHNLASSAPCSQCSPLTSIMPLTLASQAFPKSSSSA